MDRFVKGIFPTGREIGSYNTQLVPILMVPEASSDNSTATRKNDVTDGSVMAVEAEGEEHVLRVVRDKTLRTILETPSLATKKGVESYKSICIHHSDKNIRALRFAAS